MRKSRLHDWHMQAAKQAAKQNSREKQIVRQRRDAAGIKKGHGPAAAAS